VTSTPEKAFEAARTVFASQGPGVTLGAVVREGRCDPEPLVTIPLRMMNRHGLVAGATGTGKTKTLQLMAEQLSAAGVPVFVADMKGDVSGIAVAGETNAKIAQRVTDTGYPWTPNGYPVEFLSLTGRRGAQLRATVSSFGPLLLAKILDLNDTQASVLSLVFKYCDDKGLLLLDFSDLRAVLQYLTGDGAGELKDYGAMSQATVGVLLREMVELEQQGAEAFFGEPEFDLDDLLQIDRDGRGVVSVLELTDVQDRPALFSTFMMWMLARLYHDLPEVGDRDKPKLVFFFDEAHLLFANASKAFLEQVQQVVRLIRSKGVGIFFVTQTPKDVPAEILGQLGHKMQHALRAFTPEDDAALKATARTFPKTEFYDVQQTLQSLGIGEAFVTVLTPKGVPTPPFPTRLIPPASRMGPLTEEEIRVRLDASAQIKKYAQAVDRESARERLAARATAPEETPPRPTPGPPPTPKRGGKPAPSPIEQILKSPVARTVAGQLTRGLLGALLGGSRKRSRW